MCDLHVDQLPATLAGHFHHGAGLVLGNFDDQRLERLFDHAVVVVQDHVRLADGKLETFAAHGLDEHGKVQDAAAGDRELLGAGDRLGAEGDVLLQLLHEPLAEVAAGQVPAFLAGQGRGVHAEGHLQRRLVDHQAGQRPRRIAIAHRIADLDVLQPHQGDDVAGLGRLDLGAAQVLEDVDRDDPRGVILSSFCIKATSMPGLTSPE